MNIKTSGKKLLFIVIIIQALICAALLYFNVVKVEAIGNVEEIFSGKNTISSMIEKEGYTNYDDFSEVFGEYDDMPLKNELLGISAIIVISIVLSIIGIIVAIVNYRKKASAKEYARILMPFSIIYFGLSLIYFIICTLICNKLIKGLDLLVEEGVLSFSTNTIIPVIISALLFIIFLVIENRIPNDMPNTRKTIDTKKLISCTILFAQIVALFFTPFLNVYEAEVLDIEESQNGTQIFYNYAIDKEGRSNLNAMFEKCLGIQYSEIISNNDEMPFLINMLFLFLLTLIIFNMVIVECVFFLIHIFNYNPTRCKQTMVISVINLIISIFYFITCVTLCNKISNYNITKYNTKSFVTIILTGILLAASIYSYYYTSKKINASDSQHTIQSDKINSYVLTENLNKSSSSDEKEIIDLIIKYKDLLDKGIITEEEYNKKKDSLLK